MLLLLVATQRLSYRSLLVGRLVAIGLTLRLALGFVLFWISWLQLPVLRALQAAPGFWTLAPDAPGYHATAMLGAEQGLSAIPDGSASVAFSRTLALWMAACGTSPFSAVLFNAACYVVACALVAWTLDVRRNPHLERAAATVVGAFTFSPMLLFVSTQALKDTFFVLAATLVASAAWTMSAALMAPGAQRRRLWLTGAAIVLGVWITAGIRSYYAILLCLCLGVLFAAVWLFGRRVRVGRLLATALLTITMSLLMFIAGSQGFWMRYLPVLIGHGDAQRPTALLQQMRSGFVRAGGTTNIAAVDGQPVPAEPARSAAGPSTVQRLTGLARVVGTGLATLFIPIAVLRALSIVEIPHSILMTFADVDTLFLDLTLLLVGGMVARGWRDSRNGWAYLLFSAALGLSLAGLMAYIVTNVGTLVRLRLMLAVPLWTLPFALPRSGPIAVSATAARRQGAWTPTGAGEWRPRTAAPETPTS